MEELLIKFKTQYPNLCIDTSVEGFTDEVITPLLEYNSSFYGNTCPHSERIILLMTASDLARKQEIEKNNGSTKPVQNMKSVKVGDVDIDYADSATLSPEPRYAGDIYGMEAWSLIQECNMMRVATMGVNLVCFP